MFKHKKIRSKIGLALFMSFSCGSLFAANVADVSFNGDSLSLTPLVSFDSAGLRVSSENTDVTQVFQSGDNISISLSGMPDGAYKYELGLHTKSDIDPAGDNGDSIPPDDSQSGQFQIINGVASVFDNAANAEVADVDATND